MPAKNKSAKAAKKSVKMRDLKPSKDAKGGGTFRTSGNTLKARRN
jgi:hypothetical protein